MNAGERIIELEAQLASARAVTFEVGSTLTRMSAAVTGMSLEEFGNAAEAARGDDEFFNNIIKKAEAQRELANRQPQ